MNNHDTQISDDMIMRSIHDINAAQTTKELIKVWKRSFHAFGFDFLSYSLFSGFGAHEKTPYRRTFFSNIPVQVQEYYFESHAKPFDPVLKYTFSSMNSLWLSDADKIPYFQEEQPKEFIREALEIVKDGLCVPIIGPNLMKGYLYAGYAHEGGSNRFLFKKGDLKNWQILGLCHRIHARYCKLSIAMQTKIDLTKREMDVLHLVVSGKTNREIGEDLGISINTVNSYLKNLFMKMKTTDRVTTALKAYSMNLITFPQDIPPSQYIEVDSALPLDNTRLQHI